MPKNVSTAKEYGTKYAERPVAKATQPRSASAPNRPAINDGQMKGNAQRDKFADPLNDGPPAKIGGLEGLYDDIGERSGFVVDGYLDKGGTAYGEAAKFNFLPPGMDISNQENAEINEMKLYKVTEESYPGDGWMPKPRDIPE
jgi:hypothetical protein